MDAAHTQGRLTCHENGDANSFTLNDSEGHWLLSLLHNGRAVLTRQRANLRRLCACWNACEGISTEALERTDFIELYRARLRSVCCHVTINEAAAPGSEGRFVIRDSEQSDGFRMSGDDERDLIARVHQHFFGF